MLFFRSRKYTDTEIIKGLQEGGDQEDAVLKFMYSSYYPKVKKFILSKGGNEVEAKDIFQDSIIVFYQNVVAQKFKQKAKISTYLFTLARNMWINKLKRLVKVSDLKDVDFQNPKDQPIDYILATERNEFALELMKVLSDDCRKLLTLSIYQKYSMKKICEIMGYKNEQIARNKKSKCLKYLKKAIQNSSRLSNMLKELK